MRERSADRRIGAGSTGRPSPSSASRKSGVAAARLISRARRAACSPPTPRTARRSPPEALPARARRMHGSGPAAIPTRPSRGAELVGGEPRRAAGRSPRWSALRARGVPVIGELELASARWTRRSSPSRGPTARRPRPRSPASSCAASCARCWSAAISARPLSEQALDFPRRRPRGGRDVLELPAGERPSRSGRAWPPCSTSPPTTSIATAAYARYVEAKARIFANQTEADCAVLNADDPDAAALAAPRRARVLWFSRLRPLDHGVFVRDGWIVAQAQRPRGAGLRR